MIMSLKQREIKFEPRIKLNHNMHVNLGTVINQSAVLQASLLLPSCTHDQHRVQSIICVKNYVFVKGIQVSFSLMPKM